MKKRHAILLVLGFVTLPLAPNVNAEGTPQCNWFKGSPCPAWKGPAVFSVGKLAPSVLHPNCAVGAYSEFPDNYRLAIRAARNSSRKPIFAQGVHLMLNARGVSMKTIQAQIWHAS
jgi:hypothetical protein